MLFSQPAKELPKVASENVPVNMLTSVMPICTVGRKRPGSSDRASAAEAPRDRLSAIACRRERREFTTASSASANSPLSRIRMRTIVSLSTGQPISASAGVRSWNGCFGSGET